MNFSGAEGEYFYNRYIGWSPTDNCILEAWVAAESVIRDARGSCITAAAIRMVMGWCWEREPGACLLGGDALSRLGRSLVNWASGPMLALVLEHGTIAFLDQRPVGQIAPENWASNGDVTWSDPSSGSFTIGGAAAGDCRVETMTLDGQIDEVRLSEFRGPFDPKMLLFQDVAGTLRVPSAGNAIHVENISGTRSVPTTSREEGRK